MGVGRSGFYECRAQCVLPTAPQPETTVMRPRDTQARRGSSSSRCSRVPASLCRSASTIGLPPALPRGQQLRSPAGDLTHSSSCQTPRTPSGAGTQVLLGMNGDCSYSLPPLSDPLCPGDPVQSDTKQFPWKPGE